MAIRLHPPVLGSYALSVSVRQTATTAANAAVFAMRNGATRRAVIYAVTGAMFFDSTNAGAQLRYALARFRSATPTGGTSILTNILKTRSDFADSGMVDARFLDTGLTVTGVTFDPHCHVMGNPQIQAANLPLADLLPQSYVDPVSGEQFRGIELLADEGIALRLDIVAAIGQGFAGTIHWVEHSL